MGKRKQKDEKLNEAVSNTPILATWDYKPLPKFKGACKDC